VSRVSPLVEAYLAALPLVEIAIVGAGKQCRILTGEIPAGEPVAHRYFFKSSHADLLLATIGRDGMSGKPAASIERAAAMLGAPVMTASELRRAAEQAVDEIITRVKIANQDGDLKRINYAFKVYRLEQAAKGEKSITYAGHLEAFTASLVRQAAARMA
jgi:hypothetical protein